MPPKSEEKKPCPPSRPFRSEKTGRCYAGSTAAGREAGVCPPKIDRKGQISEYVYAFVNGKHRCLKAGGATARKHLGQKSCPQGKVLADVQYRLPPDETGRVRTGISKRCVAPRGKYADLKRCEVGKVLVEARRGEHLVQTCVTERTAKLKGYKILARGDQQRGWKHNTEVPADKGEVRNMAARQRRRHAAHMDTAVTRLFRSMGPPS